MSSANIIYFYPNDKTAPAGIADTVRAKMLSVQRFYADQLGGRTFSLSDVRVVQGLWPTSHYLDFPWGRVLEDLAFQQAAPDSCSPPYAILVCFVDPSIPVNGGTPCGGKLGPSGTWHYAADGGGLAVFEAGALADKGRWVEHELGHALTLPHTPGCEGLVPGSLQYGTCTIAVMWSAWNPESVFLDTDAAPEKGTLLAHPLVDIVIDLAAPPAPEPIEPLPEPDPTIIPEPPRQPKMHRGWGKGGRPKP